MAPSADARWRGLFPTPSEASTRAPRLRRSRTVEQWLRLAAPWRGVPEMSSWCSRLAPASSRSSITCTEKNETEKIETPALCASCQDARRAGSARSLLCSDPFTRNTSEQNQTEPYVYTSPKNRTTCVYACQRQTTPSATLFFGSAAPIAQPPENVAARI